MIVKFDTITASSKTNYAPGVGTERSKDKVIYGRNNIYHR